MIISYLIILYKYRKKSTGKRDILFQLNLSLFEVLLLFIICQNLTDMLHICLYMYQIYISLAFFSLQSMHISTWFVAICVCMYVCVGDFAWHVARTKLPGHAPRPKNTFHLLCLPCGWRIVQSHLRHERSSMGVVDVWGRVLIKLIKLYPWNWQKSVKLAGDCWWKFEYPVNIKLAELTNLEF